MNGLVSFRKQPRCASPFSLLAHEVVHTTINTDCGVLNEGEEIWLGE
jgi:hypothetical protein